MVATNTGTVNPAAEKAANEGALIQGGSLLQGNFESGMDAGASYTDLENVSKATLTRLDVSILPREIPDFEAPGATKDTLIAEWLKNWISSSLQAGTITEQHLLPKKGEIAVYLGVSVGTVQNAIRYIEDDGFVESKQRIGTLIRDPEASGFRMRKQTSKRDQAVTAIKHYIVAQDFQPGQTLPSAREIAKTLQSAPNTTRLALEFLSSTGILKSLGNRGNKANWALREIPELDESSSVNAIESETLIDQLERDLKMLIAESFDLGAKLPSHLELSDQFKVSIKTVHDAMKRLADQNIIHSKRGRYGTYVMRKPDAAKLMPMNANIFVPAEEVSFYNYEKVEQHLKTLIRQSYKVGDKLPAMGILSKELDVSSNTIRKALQNLAKEKMVSFSRGRYGGTYVTRIPEGKDVEPGKTFTWVSINPETVKTYRSKVTQ
jgi:DNA-binding GntR family transcriptional regulator